MHTQVLGIAGAGAIGLALAPGLAQAAPARASGSGSADGHALSAYAAYLSALESNGDSAAARDTQIVDSVMQTCPNALSSLNDLTSAQLKESALTDFADEVDADLDLAYMAPNKPALTSFATALTGLHWSSTSQSRTITRLVNAETTLLRTAPPSDLCTDATTLGAAPQSEPTTTAMFLKRYRAAAGAVRSALVGFQTLLARFETSGEHKVVAQINTLVAQYSAQSSSTESSDADTILSDLGISQS